MENLQLQTELPTIQQMRNDLIQMRKIMDDYFYRKTKQEAAQSS